MQPRHRLLDRPTDAEIGRTGVFGMDAALQANLGRAALPSFLAAAGGLAHIAILGAGPPILAELALRERAELAAEITDVRVVDVAGDDVADRVAVDLAAQPVSRFADSVERIAARREQRDDVAFAQGFARRRAVEDRLDGGCLAGVPRLRACRRWVDAGAGGPRVGAGKSLRVDAAQGSRA